ncbi:MAG: helix-turn-helix transcriptional regulator [Desulfomicrobium sp.]|nr:helix-turn-helix transcriptional regulator [Pseudomonadota bacterium]MBV1710911.1 helix-turn-helix transcriptional regulator [Desulfomicrobium sp.]MBU4570565.1 helix-turn-helix transcriptional regulator [Pseudomonadota bacterium]MBU4593329.1 helix-turn-helix transcriptional regulator [Pseudomonadota bacterium]MBV1719357.1 helix-turn-helix transcriptional regulator [Desulfomicrobium sp.]
MPGSAFHRESGKACHEFGYTQAQVAAALGLHYSTVSKIIQKFR